MNRAEVAEAFRRNHRDPINVALHVAGFYFLARGALRVLRGRLIGGVWSGALGTGLLLAGHRIEGTDPFAVMRELGGSRPRTA